MSQTERPWMTVIDLRDSEIGASLHVRPLSRRQARRFAHTVATIVTEGRRTLSTELTVLEAPNGALYYLHLKDVRSVCAEPMPSYMLDEPADTTGESA